MTIIVSNIRRPGYVYDSAKYAVLGNMIAGSIKKRTGGNYLVKSIVKNGRIKINLKVFDNNTKRYNSIRFDEETILAGRISSFLMSNGTSADVEVV
jgi:hypothetical protein